MHSMVTRPMVYIQRMNRSTDRNHAAKVSATPSIIGKSGVALGPPLFFSFLAHVDASTPRYG